MKYPIKSNWSKYTFIGAKCAVRNRLNITKEEAMNRLISLDWKGLVRLNRNVPGMHGRTLFRICNSKKYSNLQKLAI